MGYNEPLQGTLPNPVPAMHGPPPPQPDADRTAAPAAKLDGALHAFVAFDWGEEVNLETAGRLVSGEPGELTRRRRTPSSIGYSPAPLRFHLPPIELDLPELGRVLAAAEATLFDFAAVSIALHLPLAALPAESLSRLANWLARPEPIVDAVRRAAEPVHQRLLPAIRQPQWGTLGEEYFVFQFPSGQEWSSPETLLRQSPHWLARLVRLESGPLSDDEVSEALRLRIGYTPEDLLVCEWAAALLIDEECDETLQVIEFANVQLLELRHLDARLDRRIEAAYDLIQPLARSWLPFWNFYSQPLRALGELKVDANGLFARATRGLKLVGDQYLARVYRLLAARLHLDEWEQDIRESLALVQEVYQVVADQSARYRTEALELIVVLLILLEIVLALWGH